MCVCAHVCVCAIIFAIVEADGDISPSEISPVRSRTSGSSTISIPRAIARDWLRRPQWIPTG